jgi:hypothetical protein
MHVASVSFKCFIRMLQVFYLDVAYVCNGYTHVSSVRKCFRRMLQVFHLDVVKVDLVLHMLQLDPPVFSIHRQGQVTGTHMVSRMQAQRSGQEAMWAVGHNSRVHT